MYKLYYSKEGKNLVKYQTIASLDRTITIVGSIFRFQALNLFTIMLLRYFRKGLRI